MTSNDCRKITFISWKTDTEYLKFESIYFNLLLTYCTLYVNNNYIFKNEGK